MHLPAISGTDIICPFREQHLWIIQQREEGSINALPKMQPYVPTLPMLLQCLFHACHLCLTKSVPIKVMKYRMHLFIFFQIPEMEFLLLIHLPANFGYSMLREN